MILLRPGAQQSANLSPYIVVSDPILEPVGGGAVADPQFYSSIISYWELDEASGNRADSKGSNTLVDSNTVGSTTGKTHALAASFAQGSSESLSVASNSGLVTGDVDWWVATWAYPTNSSSVRIMVMKGNGTATANIEFRLMVDMFFSGTAANPKFMLQFYNSAITSSNQIASPAFTLNNWYRVVAAHDSVNNFLLMWVNGVAVTPVATTLSPVAGTKPFSVGLNYSAGQFYGGRQNDVILGKGYIPTQTDIDWDYNSGNGRQYSEFAAL